MLTPAAAAAPFAAFTTAVVIVLHVRPEYDAAENDRVLPEAAKAGVAATRATAGTAQAAPCRMTRRVGWAGRWSGRSTECRTGRPS